MPTVLTFADTRQCPPLAAIGEEWRHACMPRPEENHPHMDSSSWLELAWCAWTNEGDGQSSSKNEAEFQRGGDVVECSHTDLEMWVPVGNRAHLPGVLTATLLAVFCGTWLLFFQLNSVVCTAKAAP